MNLEALLNIVECVADDDNHIVREPVALSCGHCICRECIQQDEQFICYKCNIINKNNLKDSKTSFATEFLIKEKMSELLPVFEAKFNSLSSRFQDLENNVQETCRIKKEFLKEEIDIRIESLKSDLDSIRDKMHLEVEDEFKTIDKKAHSSRFEFEIDQPSQHHYKKHEDLLYAYQKETRKMSKAIKSSAVEFNLTFECSNFKLSHNLIGTLAINKGKVWKIEDLVKKIESKSFKEIKIDVYGTDVCVLPNDSIMITCYDNGVINVYDKNFKLLKKVNTVNHQYIKALSSTTNNVDKIFIADTHNNRIIMTDLDFNYINAHHVEQPYGICFKQYIYACSYSEAKVCKLDERLRLISSYTVQNGPWQIKISDDKAIVGSRNCIRIYDNENFATLFADLDISGDICLFNEYFLVNKADGLAVYNMDGNLEKQLEKVLNDVTVNSYHGLHFAGNKLILTTRRSKLMIVE